MAKDSRTSDSELQVSNPIPPPPAVALSMTCGSQLSGTNSIYGSNTYGKPQAFGYLNRLIFSSYQALRTRDDGNSGLRGQIPSSMFKSECFDALRRRTRKDNPRSGGSSRKVGILRQESVSRNDRVDIVSFRDVYYLISIALLTRVVLNWSTSGSSDHTHRCMLLMDGPRGEQLDLRDGHV